MYYIRMAQPKQPPTSLRIPEATRERVEKWASEQGLPRNAAYVQLIERGLKAAGPHPGLNERPKPKAGRVVQKVRGFDPVTGEPL